MSARRAQPIADGLCLEGLARAAWALRRAYHTPDDAAAREAMSTPACSAGWRWPTPASAQSTASPRRWAGPTPRRMAPPAPRCCRTSPRSISRRCAGATRTGRRCRATPRVAVAAAGGRGCGARRSGAGAARAGGRATHPQARHLRPDRSRRPDAGCRRPQRPAARAPTRSTWSRASLKRRSSGA